MGAGSGNFNAPNFNTREREREREREDGGEGTLIFVYFVWTVSQMYRVVVITAELRTTPGTTKNPVLRASSVQTV